MDNLTFFTDEKTRSQNNQVTRSRSHGYEILGLYDAFN
jgi:hypothetical protein